MFSANRMKNIAKRRNNNTIKNQIEAVKENIKKSSKWGCYSTSFSNGIKTETKEYFERKGFIVKVHSEWTKISWE